VEQIKENIENGKSLTPQEEKLKQLKTILPEAFAEGKIDWEKLKATLGEDVNFSNERYVLNWAGKSDAFKVLQIASTKTLAPAKDESVNFDETQNIFIEGENLEVLKVLQKSYFGKVKMIYIDPPYNTGNDSFIYPDNFSESKEEYQKRVGDKDEDGYMIKDGLFQKNSKENGQYHSNWLNMMYPRLFLAKNLLRQDGMIFVSIDDNEIHNLRLLMNEVFGEENFVAAISVQSNPRGRQSDTYIASVHDYLIVYVKSVDIAKLNGAPLTEKQKTEYKYTDDKNEPYRLLGLRQRGAASKRSDRPDMYFPIYVNRGSKEISLVDSNNCEPVYPRKSDCSDGRWMWGKEKCGKDVNLLVARLIERRNEYDIFVKDYLNRGDSERTRKYKSIWDAKEYNNQAGTQEVKSILECDAMSFPKPKNLLIDICRMGLDNKDVCLDFFAGSGTTAHAVMDLNKEDGGSRKFICVQLPELCNQKSEAYKSGYKTIADIAKERIRRVIQKINKEINGKIDFENCKQDFGFKVFILADSNFKQWRGDLCKDAESLEKQMKLFVNPVSETATTENMVYELLLKSGKDINSKVEHKDNYYCVNNNELVLMLENINQEIIDAVLKVNPQKVIALDNIFAGNDQLKTNTVLQMRDAGIEFKSI